MGFNVAGHALTMDQAVDVVCNLLARTPGAAVDVDAENEADTQQLQEISASVESRLAGMKASVGFDVRKELTNGTLRLSVERRTAGDCGSRTEAARPTLVSDPLPLRIDENGDYRIGKSNVLFDTVVVEFEAGGSPEYIAHAHDTLRLADIYAVLAWYMNHKDEAQSYLKHREEKAAELRRKIDATQKARPGFRADLLARRARMEQGNAAPGK